MSADRAPILPLLEALPRAKAASNGSWRACCPVHDDSTPSLDWRVTDDGAVLLLCRAGCTTEHVVAAVGGTMADLFAPAPDVAASPRAARVIRTTDYPIRDASGALVATHIRRDLSDGDKTFAWRDAAGRSGLRGTPVTSLPLYGSEHLVDRPPGTEIVITEGEKAADALVAVGSHSLGTVTGAGTAPDAGVLEDLRGRHVALWPDADRPGRRHMHLLASRLRTIAASVRWLEPPDDVPSGWDAADALTDAADPAAILRDLVARIGDVPDDADTTDETPGDGGSGRSVPPDPGEWGDIEPLTMDAPLPPFPVHLLPPWMADMVRAVSANTETDVSMAALTALGLASVPLSNRFAITTSTWTERGCNVFVVSVADSGEMKSAVFAALDAPLREHERMTIDDEAPDRRSQASVRKEIETGLGVAKEELKRAMRAEVTARGKAAAGEASEGKVEEALRAIEAARDQVRRAETELDEETERTVPPYALLADDSTPEALQRQMAQQDGRVGMVSPESELFLMAAGRYADKGPSLQVYLSGFSGDPIRGDRITRDSPPVDHPGLAIVIATQPIVLEGARRNDHFVRRGLLARFLYAVPASRAGTRHLAGRPAIPASVGSEYRDKLMRLCRMGDGQTSGAPVLLRILGEAERRLVEWHDRQLEPRRHRESGDLGSSEAMASWAGRLHGTVARVAAVLHLATHLADASSMAIEPGTVTAAITIGEWAIEHAYAAFGIARLDNVGHDAMRLRRWYRTREGRGSSFTVRDATRGLRALDVDRIRAAISRLEEHGYVRVQRVRPGPTGGRPSEVVHVHPDGIEEVA